jgi:serine/threonine protein kinase
MYSLGVLLLEMLTGTNPFKADTFINTAMNHIQMDVPRLTGNLARFQPLLDNMLAKKPAERFASMNVLIEALDKIAPVTSISPMPDYASAMLPDRRKSASTSVPVSTVQTTVTSSQTHAIPVKVESPNSISTSASLDTSADEFQNEFLAEAEKLLHASEVIISHPVPTRKTPAPKSVIPVHSLGRSSTTTGSGRTRPLPSNLFDD